MVPCISSAGQWSHLAGRVGRLEVARIAALLCLTRRRYGSRAKARQMKEQRIETHDFVEENREDEALLSCVVTRQSSVASQFTLAAGRTCADLCISHVKPFLGHRVTTRRFFALQDPCR